MQREDTEECWGGGGGLPPLNMSGLITNDQILVAAVAFLSFKVYCITATKRLNSCSSSYASALRPRSLRSVEVHHFLPQLLLFAVSKCLAKGASGGECLPTATKPVGASVGSR